MQESEYRALSLWHDTLRAPLLARPPLESDETVDVAIVGAGYTGLWTAYYLEGLEPTPELGLRVAGAPDVREPAPRPLRQRDLQEEIVVGEVGAEFLEAGRRRGLA